MGILFERMTIFCRELDKSLAFYRDTLGLVVIEEKQIEGVAAGSLLRLPPCRLRIALLAETAAEHAVVGLFEVSNAPLESTPRSPRPLYGQTALVLSTLAFQAVYARLKAADTPFLTPPVRYPKRQASARSPAGIYNEMICYDADGVLVSVMQIDPLSEEPRI